MRIKAPPVGDCYGLVKGADSHDLHVGLRMVATMAQEAATVFPHSIARWRATLRNERESFVTGVVRGCCEMAGWGGSAAPSDRRDAA